MKKLIGIWCLILVFFSMSAVSQNVVSRNDTVEVWHGNKKLQHPWATGINAAQVSNIDFNLDGIMDIFLFEPNNEYNITTGDKIYPFVKIPGTDQYHFEPKYRSKFPVVEDHCFLKDYNGDGKADIFTRDIRDRVSVYTNVSDTALEFKLAKRVLKTDTSDLPPLTFWTHFGEIYWNYSETPSFTDIDNDGDIDILGPSIYGHYLEYNKNMSMEKYGHADSLEFKLTNTCWGFFFEDLGYIFLDTCDIVNVASPEFQGKPSTGNDHGEKASKSGKHSSSTILALDLDGDGDKDLIEGDADRPYLYSFTNVGKLDSAHIGSYVDQFPPVDSFNLMQYGIPTYADADDDGVNDLIVSTFFDQYSDTGSIWFYKNVGTSSIPNFSLQTKSFLQGEMIDVGTGSRPVFFDYNGDSLMDLAIGNTGYFKELGVPSEKFRSQLAIYENTGTKTKPQFTLVSLDYDSISKLPLDLNANKPSYGYHPCFGDLDGDGDEDMMLGDHRGRIHHFENQPVGGKAHFVLVSAQFQNIKVPEAAPTLFDIDKDGLLDLLIGGADGKVHYYKNTSAGGLQFTLLDNDLGLVDVKDVWDPNPGRSKIFFYEDSLENITLFSGSKGGHIRYYDSIRVNDTLATTFNLVEKKYQEIWDGNYSSIHGTDIDYDGEIDFVVGNYSGGIALYTSEDSFYIPGIEDLGIGEITWNMFPNPAQNELTIDIHCDCRDEFLYTVFNLAGEQVFSTSADSRTKLNTQHYPEGMYMLRVESKNRPIKIIERFIIRR